MMDPQAHQPTRLQGEPASSAGLRDPEKSAAAQIT